MGNKEVLSRRSFLKRSAGALGFLALPLPREFEFFVPGKQIFATANKVIDAFYLEPHEGARKLPNLRKDNYVVSAPGLNTIEPERYQVEPGSVLRLEPRDSQWAKVVLERNDQGLEIPIAESQDGRYYNGDVFVRLTDFDEIKQWEPMSFNPGTQPQDKEIVVLNYPTSEMLLVEGNEIVMRCPVVLGDSHHRTPNGDYNISFLYPTKNMGNFPTVGFSMCFQPEKGLYLHEAIWWTAGEWSVPWRSGSSGCVNLPDKKLATINVGGEEIGIAQATFLWASTNYPMEQVDAKGYVSVDWKYPNRIPVHIIQDISLLKGKLRNNNGRFDEIIGSYKSQDPGSLILRPPKRP